MVRALLPLGIVLAFGQAACAGVSAAPMPPPAPAVKPKLEPLGAPFLVPGESMIYEVTFRGMRVGRVQVAVGKPGFVNERSAIIIKSAGETDGLLSLIGDLDWNLETTLDMEKGTPIKTVEHAVVTLAGKTETTDRTREESDTHSIHSAAVILRGWHSLPAQEASFEMRIDAAHVDVTLHEAAREFLDVADKPAVRYDGVARSKFPFKLWFSDDAARVPLLLRTATKWGNIVVELVEYNAPRD
jgi:hypothetical protein